MTSSTDRGECPKLLVLLGLLVLIGLRAHHGIDNMIDDAYITLRHSLNMARGYGFLYNPPEHVLGTTTPLYAGTIGLIAMVTGPDSVLWLSVGINLLAECLLYFLLLRIGELWTGSQWFGLTVAICWALNIRDIEMSTAGMEAPVYTCLIYGALLALTFERHTLAAVLGAFTFLCRPDGILLATLVLAAIALRERKLPWRHAFLMLAIVTPWLLFATWYYGNPVPQSVLAKSARPWHLDWDNAISAFVYQFIAILHGRELFFDVGYRLAFQLKTAPIVRVAYYGGFVVNLALSVWGVRHFWKSGDALRRRLMGLFLTFGLCYIALYSVGNPLMLGWYRIPVEPIMVLSIGSGLWFLGHKLAGKRPERKVGPLLLVCLVALQLTQFLTVHGFRPREDVLLRNIFNDDWDKVREHTYINTAKLLNKEVDRDTVILCCEIGAFGYFSNATILDSVGLVNKGMGKYYPVPESEMVGNYAIPTQAVLDNKPDYVMSLEHFIRNSLLKSKEFLSQYELRYKVDSGVFGSDGLLVFIRKDKLEDDGRTLKK